MRVVRWKIDAIAQFNALLDYVADRNEDAAERLFSGFVERVNRLAEWPGVGRPGREDGTRELVVHPNYIIVYRVASDVVEVVRVLHARQRYP